MKLLKQISETKAEKAKKLFVVTVLDDEGVEVEKKAKAFKISDIKAYFGDKFVNAELHDDEVAPPSDDDMSLDDNESLEDESAGGGESREDEDDLGEPEAVKESKIDFDRKLVLHGAMSKKEFDAKWKKPKPTMSAQHKRMAGPGGIYKNLIATVPNKSVKEDFVTEMAKRTAPADFWKMMTDEYGVTAAQKVTWAQIKAVADKNDVLIPAYIRDNKVARGLWTAKPTDIDAPVHEPKVEKKPPFFSKPEAAREVARAEPKTEPKPATQSIEYKDFYTKADFPETEFVWTTTYNSGYDLMQAIEKHHGVKSEDTESVTVDKRNNYYVLKKGTMTVLGRKTITDGGMQPGRGRVTYVAGNIALSKKAAKSRDDEMYGFLIKPQHGAAYLSVGTQHSYGPWNKFTAEANVRDKYQHFEYNDEFGHGTIQVVKVKKVDGRWERA